MNSEKLPQNLKVKFYEFLSENLSLQDFEKWLYETPELENYFSADKYTELLEYNYRKNQILDIKYFIIQYINFNDYIRWFLLEIINYILVKKNNSAIILSKLIYFIINSNYQLTRNIHENDKTLSLIYKYSINYEITLESIIKAVNSNESMFFEYIEYISNDINNNENYEIKTLRNRQTIIADFIDKLPKLIK